VSSSVAARSRSSISATKPPTLVAGHATHSLPRRPDPTAQRLHALPLYPGRQPPTPVAASSQAAGNGQATAVRDVLPARQWPGWANATLPPAGHIRVEAAGSAVSPPFASVSTDVRVWDGGSIGLLPAPPTSAHGVQACSGSVSGRGNRLREPLPQGVHSRPG
jgi:hypothetical protein